MESDPEFTKIATIAQVPPCTMPNTFTEFQQNLRNFWVIQVTDKQTNKHKQTNRLHSGQADDAM